jgi:hypothetical protein
MRMFLEALLCHSQDATIRHLALAVLAGEWDALPCLWDRAQETGEPCMQSLKIGQCYLIRTMHREGGYTGRVKAVTFTDLVLGEAAYVRYQPPLRDVLRTGNLLTVDPFLDEVTVSAAVVLDAAPWNHELPREPKGLAPDDGEIPF